MLIANGRGVKTVMESNLRAGRWIAGLAAVWAFVEACVLVAMAAQGDVPNVAVGVVVIALGLALAAALVATSGRGPAWTVDAALVALTALITAGIYVSRDWDHVGELFYLWVVVFALLHRPLRRAATHIVVCAIASVAVALAVERTGTDWTQWITAAATVVVVGGLVITARRRFDERVARLARVASTDALTGLGNRRAFERKLAVALQRARRTGQAGCLILADIDRFKPLNDHRGHSIGDQALLCVARALRQRARGDDHAARIGGDEFAFIATARDQAGALQLAQELRAAVVSTPDDLPDLTVTLGVAEFSGRETPEHVIEAADTAMYVGKRAGGDRIETASPR